MASVSFASSSSLVSPSPVLDDSGWLAFEPSRYRAIAFRPSSADRA
jgi:hypothetical protein